MTSEHDFDRRITAWLEAEAPARAPDRVLPGALDRTLRSRPLPAWLIPERWIPMQLTMRRVVVPRALIIAAILTALLALAVVFIVVGSRAHLPAPFGLAKAGLIAYDAGGDLWVSNLDGTGLKPLTSGDSFDVSPTWSPDGTQLAYWSHPSAPTAQNGEGPASLMLIKPDGSPPKTLAKDLIVSVYDNPLSWSPDSRTIVYSTLLGTPSTTAALTQLDAEIDVVSVDGGPPRTVVHPGHEPAWSPDGQWIAYQSGTDNVTFGIYVVAKDGTGAHKVSHTVGNVDSFSAAQWSPNGKQIAFTANDGGSRVYVADADGSRERVITAGTPTEAAPAWSPSGSRIAFVRQVSTPVGGGLPDLNITIADADGTNVVKLLHPPVLYAATWSPDEKWVFGYVPSDAGASDIIAVDTAGLKDPVRLSTDGNVGYASWQRLLP